jgi:hypothetical protein
MNFLVGFILQINGGNEKEAFWFFHALLEKSNHAIPFDGLNGFFKPEFPLLI